MIDEMLIEYPAAPAWRRFLFCAKFIGRARRRRPIPRRLALQQLRNHMLKSAAPVRKERTTRQLPSVKGKALRELLDASVSYLTFSEHLKRDFGDPVPAYLIHSDGDARIGTAERPAEFFHTVATRDPAPDNFKKAFLFNRYRFGLECIAEIFLDSQTNFQAMLTSTALATDG